MRFPVASFALAGLHLLTACGYTFQPDAEAGDAGLGDAGVSVAPQPECDRVVCPAATHCNDGVCIDDAAESPTGDDAAESPTGDDAAESDPDRPVEAAGGADAGASPGVDSHADAGPPADEPHANPDPDPGPDSNASGETCDDPLPFRFRVQVEGDTRGLSNDIEDDCAISWGPDVVYSFVADHTGVVLLQVESVPDDDGARWDTTLYLRRACGDGDLACNDDVDIDDDGWPDIGWSALSACVEEGRTYHVVVDGYWADSEGPFVLVGDLQACDWCDEGACR